MGYDYYSDYAGIATLLGVLGSMIFIIIVLFVALLILSIIGHWFMYQKAGQRGWAAIVPFYSSYMLYRITWGNGWLFAVPLVLTLLNLFTSGLLSSLFWLANFVVSCITHYKTAKAFGKGVGYTLGLIFLSPIFAMILGLSNSIHYRGIPCDGFSYDEMNEKYHQRNDNMRYQQPSQYQTPPQHQNQNTETATTTQPTQNSDTRQTQNNDNILG